ncbi:MAG: hypothetical protein LBQ54_10725 [Planctomycetaceae bacterium]|jgi:hypothetical protein|nr:hypothetical protein [Planctomycetaceae bacterium]
MMRKILFFALVLCWCLGCGNKVGLKGKVTFSDNGELLPFGEVGFSTPTYFARATIQPDGSYVVSSEGTADGLPPGEYNVTITAFFEDKNPNPKRGPNGMPVDNSRHLIDPKYSSQATSGLKAAVDSSTRVLDFKVDRAKGF